MPGSRISVSGDITVAAHPVSRWFSAETACEVLHKA
jgi:hypothetical protein